MPCIVDGILFNGIMSTATQLASVQAEIATIIGGAQSYTYDGVSVAKATLATLHQREADLLRRQAAESHSRPMFTRGTFGRVT